MPLYLLLPFFAAILYAISSMLLKRGLKEGATMRQSFHIANVAVGLLFLPLFFLETQPVAWHLWYQPLLAAVAFFVGTLLTFFAIRMGDVSLVTPVMGTKVVFVAFSSLLLFSESPSAMLWFAATLTAVGIFIMGFKDMRTGQSAFLVTVSFTLLSAAVFGLSDVLVQRWARPFGPFAFVSLSSVAVAVFSIFLTFTFDRPVRRLVPPSGARKWIVGGGILVGIQAILVALALSFFNDATGVNVVYSSRGFWAIVLVYLLGPLIGNLERHTARHAFAWRAAGTALLTVAIVIAVIDRSRALSKREAESGAAPAATESQRHSAIFPPISHSRFTSSPVKS